MHLRATLVLFALTSPMGMSAQADGGVERAAGSITPPDLLQHVGALAHDSMRGRDTPSSELDKAADYVAAQFQRFGLAPGGDRGTYVQRYPLYRVVSTVNVQTSSAHWSGGRDVIQLSGGSTRVADPTQVVFVAGEGTLEPDAALEGAAVFYAAALRRGGRQLSAGSRQMLARIRSQEPATIIVIAEVSNAVWSFLVRQQRGASVTTARPDAADGVPVLLVRPRTAQPLIGNRDLSAVGGAVQVDAMAGITVTVDVRRGVQELSAPNTVGILRGSDPALRNEYVVYSAHMDHVGVGRPVDNDSIYNGADDDASGTAGVIELAEAFARLNPRPRRSMIFLAVSGEEDGLFGSEHFAANPPVPLDQIVANINADMIGRNWADTIVVIGKEHSTLGETLNAVNREHPELNMAAIDDLWPQERFYFRSDHYNFARRGVPILFFFNGTHSDYHRPSDQVEKIDAEKQARLVKLMFYLGLAVANAAERPQWDPESYRQIVEGDAR